MVPSLERLALLKCDAHRADSETIIISPGRNTLPERERETMENEPHFDSRPHSAKCPVVIVSASLTVL